MDTLPHSMQLYGLMDLRVGNTAVNKRVLSRDQLAELSAHCQALTRSTRSSEAIVLSVRRVEGALPVYFVRTEGENKTQRSNDEQVLAIYEEGTIIERVESPTMRFFDYGVENTIGHQLH